MPSQPKISQAVMRAASSRTSMSMARFHTTQHNMVVPATHPNDMKVAAPKYSNGSHGDCHKGWTRSPASSINAPSDDWCMPGNR